MLLLGGFALFWHWGNQRVAFSAKTTIDRRDFGLNYNQVLETGGVVMADKADVVKSDETIRKSYLGY